MLRRLSTPVCARSCVSGCCTAWSRPARPSLRLSWQRAALGRTRLFKGYARRRRGCERAPVLPVEFYENTLSLFVYYGGVLTSHEADLDTVARRHCPFKMPRDGYLTHVGLANLADANTSFCVEFCDRGPNSVTVAVGSIMGATRIACSRCEHPTQIFALSM